MRVPRRTAVQVVIQAPKQELKTQEIAHSLIQRLLKNRYLGHLTKQVELLKWAIVYDAIASYKSYLCEALRAS